MAQVGKINALSTSLHHLPLSLHFPPGTVSDSANFRVITIYTILPSNLSFMSASEQVKAFSFPSCPSPISTERPGGEEFTAGIFIKNKRRSLALTPPDVFR